MKKYSTVIVSLISALILLTFGGCSAPANSPSSESTSIQSTTTVVSSDSSADSSTEKVFSVDELKKYDGQNGNSAYVAVDGVVYDVTNASKWQKGSHQGLTAGKDLSKEINSSPHGKSVLKDIPVVGKLQN